jgi:hypothetical protein
MEQQAVEQFHPTSGRVSAVLVLLLAGVVVVVGVADPGSVAAPVMAGAVLAAVLAWATMLRPALWATRADLVMRNMLETVHVPLAAVEQLAVRQVLVVRAGEKRYVSTVVGRPWRKVVRAPRPGSDSSGGKDGEKPYADYVEERLHHLMEEARETTGVRQLSDEQQALADGVRREPAWLPIILVTTAVAVFVVTLFL